MLFKLSQPGAGVNTPQSWQMNIYTVRCFLASIHLAHIQIFFIHIYIFFFSRKESLSFATQIVLLGGQFLLFQWLTSAACLQPAPAPGVMDTGLKVDSVVNMNWNIFISYSTCGFLHILHNSTLRESGYIAYVHENLIILIPVLSRGLN